MALKIRLRQQGRKNHIVYRLVLSESRSPRDGRYLETLGWYDPYQSAPEATLNVKGDRILYWLVQGAELTEKATFLVKQGAPKVLEEYQQRIAEKRRKKCLQRRAYRARKSAE
ncbi:30S ribosomal protein S16 [Candidatus Clavichlamydia salmonicola]|uniref:30S ribosomal protein S16 n=1 Tax=Candidatus Clavichlamydia salmonicola TaxID=469812 RepID=UPI001890B696|nr:30S ribosomal protein S16 [Candidatus Clavichlamydia salmonicola]